MLIFRDRINFSQNRQEATTNLLLTYQKSDVRYVLDLGCGSGQMTNTLVEIFSDAVVIGLDISKESLLHGKELNIQSALIQADALKLPFEDNVFDIIVMLELIEHFENSKALLQEVSRVLSNRGLLLISSPNKSSITGITGRLISRVFGLSPWKAWDNSHKRLYAPDELAREIKEAGFDILRIAGYWPFPEGCQHLPRLVGEIKPIKSFVHIASENNFFVRAGFITNIFARRK